MQQLQFDFFYPLTEQIPLDLDYSVCVEQELYVPIHTGPLYLINTGSTGYNTITASHLTLDIETTKIKVKEEPSLCRKVLYKCLGLQWEKK